MSNRTCPTPSKRSWPTYATAKQSASILAKHKGAKLHPYKCRGCKLWHLTSQAQADTKQAEAKQAITSKLTQAQASCEESG